MTACSHGLNISLLPLLLVLVAAVAMNAKALPAPRTLNSYSVTSPSHQTNVGAVDPTLDPSCNRRTILGLGAVLTNVGILTGAPMDAFALQARNEALCGTGFFTNIALYKCTEIGDISDEGRSRPLSTTEEGSMQSLMDKMGMDLSVFDEGENKKHK
jgi:hypothetical protein